MIHDIETYLRAQEIKHLHPFINVCSGFRMGGLIDILVLLPVVVTKTWITKTKSKKACNSRL